jgi:hypothetical protein
LEQLSERHQRLIRKQAHTSESFRKPRKAKPSAFGEEFDSLLELDFAYELGLWIGNGAIAYWRYHLLRFRIAKNVSYTPDFFTEGRLGGAFAGLAVFEVKGSWKMKNARDARTKLEVAAYQNQWCSWHAVTRDKGIWKVETIHAHEATLEEPR